MIKDENGHDIVGGRVEDRRKKCSYGIAFNKDCLGNCSRITYTTGSGPIGEYLSAVCKVTGDSMTEYV